MQLHACSFCSAAYMYKLETRHFASVVKDKVGYPGRKGYLFLYRTLTPSSSDRRLIVSFSHYHYHAVIFSSTSPLGPSCRISL
jgi:hypothetical protein